MTMLHQIGPRALVAIVFSSATRLAALPHGAPSLSLGRAPASRRRPPFAADRRLQSAGGDPAFDRNDDDEQQRQALEALYRSTNGDGWVVMEQHWMDDAISYCEWEDADCLIGTYMYRDNAGFYHFATQWTNETISYCEWEGVYCCATVRDDGVCDDGHDVLGLWLGSSNLTGSIPAEIGNLINLDYMILSANQITGKIPAEIGSLVNLKVMDLIKNKLTGEIPTEIGNLVSLTTMRLDENKLAGKIPPELWDLPLEYLHIDGNKFDEILIPSDKCKAYMLYNPFMQDLNVCFTAFWSSTSTVYVVLVQWMVWAAIFYAAVLFRLARRAWGFVCRARNRSAGLEQRGEEDGESEDPNRPQPQGPGALKKEMPKIQLLWSSFWVGSPTFAGLIDGYSGYPILFCSAVFLVLFVDLSLSSIKDLVSSTNICANNDTTSDDQDHAIPQSHEDQPNIIMAKHYSKLSVCLLMMQIFVAVAGYLFVALSTSKDAYGVSLAASGVLGWALSTMIWMFTLPTGSRQWPFLVSTMILPPSCFVGLLYIGVLQDVVWEEWDTIVPTELHMFLSLSGTTCIAWMTPFYLTMNAIGEVLDARDGSTDGLIDSTFIRSMIPRYFGASIPLFYFAMHSMASFIKYPGADDASDAEDDLMEAWSNFFFGIVAIHLILAQEVWSASYLTWDGVIAFRVTALEAASFLLILLAILIALVLLAGVIPFTVEFAQYFFVFMANVPPIILGCLYFMCQRLLLEGGNKYIEERKRDTENSGGGIFDQSEMVGLFDSNEERKRDTENSSGTSNGPQTNLCVACGIQLCERGTDTSSPDVGIDTTEVGSDSQARTKSADKGGNQMPQAEQANRCVAFEI